MPIMIFAAILLFVVGISIGSFLNVCIYRIPREGLSVHKPARSICPECQTPIKAYDNIPVLSYLLLRGQCRHCHVKISVIYPIVEFITGVLFLLMLYRFGLTLDLLLACLFVVLMVPIFFIDARWYIIPNSIIVVGLISGLIVTLLIALTRQNWGYLIDHLIGTVAGLLAMWMIAALGTLIFRKPAMGGGDIKLMALFGMLLGAWPHLLLIIVLSAFIGSIVGGFFILRRQKEAGSAIPYGPFLIGAALIDLLWSDMIWRGYLTLIGWQ